MGVDGMDLRGLLAEQCHDLIVFRAQLPVVRGVAVPQDVMRHAFGDPGGRGEREDRRPEIANMGGRSTAALTRIGPRVAAGEEPAGVRVLVFQGQEDGPHRLDQWNIPILLVLGAPPRLHSNV